VSHRLPPRDSRVWWFGLVSAIVTAVVADTNAMAWLPDSTRHALSLASTIIGAISGAMMTSPQKTRREQRNDAETHRALKTIRRKP
jgi:hypothetical protein